MDKNPPSIQMLFDETFQTHFLSEGFSQFFGRGEEILSCAALAPSAINLQPWEFIVTYGDEKERLVRRLLKARLELQVKCGPVTEFSKRRKSSSAFHSDMQTRILRQTLAAPGGLI